MSKNLSEVGKKNWLSIAKNITEWEKKLYYNHEEVFQFRKFCFFIRKSVRNIFLLRLCLKINKTNFWLSGLARYFLEYKKSSIFWNLKKFFFQGFRFPKYKKSFLLRKYKKFFLSFRFLKYKDSFLWENVRIF